MQIKFSIFSAMMTLGSISSAQEPAAAPPAPVVAQPTAKSAPPATEEAPPPPTYDSVDEEPVTEANQGSYAQDPAAVPVAAARKGPQKQTSIYLGSPIFLSGAPLDAGFEMEIRSGIKLGIIIPEFGVGTRWNWVSVDKLRDDFPEVDNPEVFKGENLNGIWLSLGIRIEPEVKGKLTPYASVAFDANLWGVSFDRSQMCGIWACSSVRNYDFAPGFSGRLGLRFAPKPMIGLDIGVKPALSFKGWAFEKTQTWLEPYAGITIILDPKPKAPKSTGSTGAKSSGGSVSVSRRRGRR